MTIIDDFNRTEIQRSYIDHIVGHMDFVEIKRELWNYINREKNRYSNYSLELEIGRDAPILLEGLQTQQPYSTFNKASQSKKTSSKKPSLVGGEV